MDSVLITGANRGIGLELAKRYAASGARVFATCRIPQQAQALRALAADAANVSVHALEVTDGAAVDALRAELADVSLDVLINNAGIMGGERQGVSDMDYAAWAEAFAVNTMAPFRLLAALRGNLQRASRPRAVTLSSQMGSLARKSAGAHAYRSSKAAVNKVMQVLALELQADGIIVCPVHPGWVRTDMGGQSASISVEESAQGLIDLIDGLEMAHSGRFWTWDGTEHPW
ncbi:MAG: SDR family oxidoreductase [Pseudomonadota bacterium]